MRSEEVHNLNLGEPRDGIRIIGFIDGPREYTAHLTVPSDWNIGIIIEYDDLAEAAYDLTKRSIYCICKSPDGVQLIVERWRALVGRRAPIALSGAAIAAKLGKALSKLSDEEIAAGLRKDFEA